MSSDIPESEKIYPSEKCPLCGGALEIDGNTSSGEEDDDVSYISCENAREENDGHMQTGAITNGVLRSWGWKI